MRALLDVFLNGVNSVGKIFEWLSSQLPESVNLALCVLAFGIGLLGFLHFLGHKDNKTQASLAQYQHYREYQDHQVVTPYNNASSIALPHINHSQAVTHNYYRPIEPLHSHRHLASQPNYWYKHARKARLTSPHAPHRVHVEEHEHAGSYSRTRPSQISQNGWWSESGAARAAY